MNEEGFESGIIWVTACGVWLLSLSLLVCRCLTKIEYLDIFLIVFGHFQ
jgi:hypothetical protein